MSNPAIEKATEDLISALTARKTLKKELSEAKRRYELASYKYKAARSMFVQAFVAIHGGIDKLISEIDQSIEAPSKTTLGERVKLIRGNESREKFALMTGISKTTLVNYETGGNSPTAEYLHNILSKFPEINPTWLLTGEGNQKRQTMEGL